MIRRKYYYSILFPNGITYIIAVSKYASRQQLRKALGTSKGRHWQFKSLKRISKQEYNKAHRILGK